MAMARCVGVLILVAGAATAQAQDTTFQWTIPPRYPKPPVPVYNPMSRVKV